MAAQLEGGGIDVAILPLIRDAVRLAKDSGYQVVYNQNSGSVNIVLAQTQAMARGRQPTSCSVRRSTLRLTASGGQIRCSRAWARRRACPWFREPRV